MNRMSSVIILLACLSLTLRTEAVSCVATDVCSCKMSDGKIVSLWDIDTSGDVRSEFKNKPQDGSSNFVFDYSPCSPINEGSGCKEDLVCQKTVTTPSKTYSVAQPKTMETSYEAEGLKFKYTGLTQGFTTRSAEITLVCDKSSSSVPKMSTVTETPSGSGHFHFSVTTKCACPGKCASKAKHKSSGLSTGSVLVILFFVFVIVYFIGGFLFLRFYKKHEGTEAMPQYEFWKDLPSKIKDGFIFTKDKVKGNKGEYEQI